MEDEVERLRSMLSDVDAWEEPEEGKPFQPFVFPQDTGPILDLNVCIDSEDDDNILSIEHRAGGQRLSTTEAETNVPDMPYHGLTFGNKAPLGEKFCPLQTVAKFPIENTAAVLRDTVSKIFFANGNLYEREWDFFYIWPPAGVTQKAVVLLPAVQVKRFLILINNAHRTRLKLDDGLLVDFPLDGTPQPRYLGRADEREKAEYLKQAVPAPTFKPDGEVPETIVPTDEALDVFKKKMQLLVEANKNGKAASKAKKRAQRSLKEKSWSNSIMHVQCYLGIREKGPEKEPRNPWKTPSVTAKTVRSILDLEKPAPFIWEGGVVFLAVDVEANEYQQSAITEIGIATLDTQDITHMAPGNGGEKWFEAIRARHFRIKEHGHLHNVDFVHGCADHFRFGQSEWISIMNAPQEIGRCFKEPYSKALEEGSSDMRCEGLVKLDDVEDIPQHPTIRSIVLVGHDVKADIAYLRRIGYNTENLINLRELVDTVSMYRSFRQEDNPRNLGSILADLDIPAWYLHNAGNDAVYTLQAMIGIAIKSAEERQDRKAREGEMQADTKEPAEKATDDLEQEDGRGSGGEGEGEGEGEGRDEGVSRTPF